MHFIRPATLSDLETICRLDREIFAYGAAEDPAVIRGRLEVFPAGCRILEWREGETTTVAGYLTCEKWAALREPALDEDPWETHDPQGQVLNITTLAVAPEFQNRQLGPLLLAEALAVAGRENCAQIVLETAKARSWYLRHGFEQIGERDQRGFPLYIMRKFVTR